MLRSTIPASIHFREHICNENLVIQADPTQIHQVIMNLVTNAVHAMAEMEGTLEVGTRRIRFDRSIDQQYRKMPAGDYVHITVRDTGEGIAEEYKDKIFEPYFTTKEKVHGTCLGLSVVHGIVESHNGQISVYSRRGEGRSFHSKASNLWATGSRSAAAAWSPWQHFAPTLPDSIWYSRIWPCRR